MKKQFLGILSIFFLFSGCISDSENSLTRFEREVERIEEYLRVNNISSVKEFSDPLLGIYMFWQDLSESGIRPIDGDSVFVDYTGKLLDNSIFDTSIEQVARENNLFNSQRNYRPLGVLLGAGRVIAGFEFGISKLEQGDKAFIIFPSLFGYGDDPRAGELRNQPLIFEMDLIEVKKNDIDDGL
ncbi:FKBP-type peptidyl-prolyl cis-trans isomerase [Mongoliitalea lutea]|nr:FKBP-type peptidyl-prolyl cis-trans isomerase [Mongoliitalea lutea]